MSYQLFLHPEAEKELLKLEKEKQKIIIEEVKKFNEEGTGYENFGLLTCEDEELYRLKIMRGKPVEINQRIIVDIFHNQFVAYAVKHRDKAYKKDVIEKVHERKY